MGVPIIARPERLASLAREAPAFVAVYDALEEGGANLAARRLIRSQAGSGSAELLLPQHESVAAAYARHLRDLPDEAFAEPGGEGDWNTAQALGHAFEARAGLCLAASLAARGRFPADAPGVVPGVPGPADATRETLARRLAVSQRLVARATRDVAGHEQERCPLEHPLVGHLRCGEWLLFAGVHDLMHLDQLDRLARQMAARAPGAGRP